MYPPVWFSGMHQYVQLNRFYLLSTTQVLLLGVGCKTSYDMVSIESSSLVYLPYIPASRTLRFNHMGPFVVIPFSLTLFFFLSSHPQVPCRHSDHYSLIHLPMYLSLKIQFICCPYIVSRGKANAPSLLFAIFIWCAYVCVCSCVYVCEHITWVEVKGKLWQSVLSFPKVWSLDTALRLSGLTATVFTTLYIVSPAPVTWILTSI